MSSLSEPARHGQTPTVLIVGDSLSLGALEIRGKEVVEQVRPSCIDLLAAAFGDMRFVIDAQVHRTSDDVRNQIDALLEAHRPCCVLVQIGGNDADLDWRRFVLSDGNIARSRISAERYEKNLRSICEKILAAGAQPILTDTTNHCLAMRGPYLSQFAGKDLVPLLERGGGQAETDRCLRIYRQTVGRLANEMNLPLAAYGTALAAHDAAAVISPDGAHPNAAAHRIIAEVFIATFAAMRSQTPAHLVA